MLALGSELMRLVVDGYNLVHQIPEMAAAQAGGKGAQALAAALRLYRDKKGHRITLVLDGGPDDQESRASLSGVPVIFSGPQQSADEVIMRLAARHGPGVLVVTDDRQLSAACASRGSQVVPSWEFAGLLMDTAQGWNASPGEGEADPGWDFTTRKKGPSRRAPKARRRRQKRKEKL